MFFSSEVNAILRQLKALVGRRCESDFDKYQLLDERDKLLCKLRQVKKKRLRESRFGRSLDYSLTLFYLPLNSEREGCDYGV